MVGSIETTLLSRKNSSETHHQMASKLSKVRDMHRLAVSYYHEHAYISL